MSSERWEVNYDGSLVWQEAATSSLNRGQGKINIIKQLFNRNGWSCEILDDTSKFIKIGLYKDNVEETIVYHVAIVNVVNEYRANSDNKNSNSSYEKRIQGQDFSELHYENKLVFGLYVVDNDEDLEKSIIVSWPEEILTNGSNRAYRVNTKVNIQPARLVGLYADKNSAYNVVTFKPEYIHAYLKNREILHRYENQNTEIYEEPQQYEALERLTGGTNILLYGVPGSGKSWTIEHEYCKKGTNVERLVFHPDYTYSDFIGQILPDVDDGGQVSYKFTPGPFTNILHDAYTHPQEEFILIIEEINRGNAPAIFGEVFQLLDRKSEIRDTNDDGFPIGTSEYGITNANIAQIVYNDKRHKVRIPSNLSIIGTMNTSDQNVFTLDTAFQRRWEMRLIENNFEHVDRRLADATILDTGITWEVFCTEINKIIVGNNARMTSAEDKRLGAYFVHLRDLQYNPNMGNLSSGEYDNLRKKEQNGSIDSDGEGRLAEIRTAIKQNRKFPEKVIKYLWDDAFKFNREIVFETSEFQSLEQVIRAFMYAEKMDRFVMFKENVRNAFTNPEE